MVGKAVSGNGGCGGSLRARLSVEDVADTVRPGVVREDAEPAAQPLLYGKKQCFVGRRSAIVNGRNSGKILSLHWILQIEYAPQILIGDG